MIRVFSITLISAFLILPVLGCSTIKTGKDIAIDNPIDTSRNKKSLNEARQEVEKSRRMLDQCLENNSGDESRCQSQKASYDKDVEDYVSLQTN